MKTILSITFFMLCFVLFGQEAKMSVENRQMLIGEQTKLNLSFRYPNPKGDAFIIWPEFDEELTGGVEIIEQSVDRDRLVDSANAIYLREQQIIVTVFDSGSYTIPPQQIRMNDSTYTTNSVDLLINTVAVDTSKGIHDNKPIYTVDYSLAERSKDWLKENWYWIAIILVLILAFVIWRYIQSRKADTEPVEEPEEIIPAHVIALETLKRLLDEEEWKSPEKKKYYSDLTNTVRNYLENRFNIHAMEQTTREIINDLAQANISEDDKVYLRKILREADMVKFAKFTPNDEDAENYLKSSIDFVNRTKSEEKAE